MVVYHFVLLSADLLICTSRHVSVNSSAAGITEPHNSKSLYTAIAAGHII